MSKNSVNSKKHPMRVVSGDRLMLKGVLDDLRGQYHREEFLSSDPLEFVYRFSDPWDQEAVALLAALLAYGNVRQIRRSVGNLIERMVAHSGSPHRFVRELGDPIRVKRASRTLQDFVHRFNRGSDVLELLRLLEKSWTRYESLGAHFCFHLTPEDKNISSALGLLIRDWRAWSGREEISDSFSYLLTSPHDGSCCKRWCMFLRWMGRKDDIDPGLWRSEGALAHTIPRGRWLRSDQLVIPLDTHTGRMSQNLGLTQRKSLGWKAALEVTENLKLFDANDPTRYDFSLSRPGIMDTLARRGKTLE